ncbi:cysteine synthase family protein [Thermococcus gorgonarius]|uniref:Cysteine synthase n=1 Tax=Thermococcus gorgonarius TaxID=71997 RepID=A0A2Z2M7W1_THEGO|nr:PLP-dependent cysteine synthase family protein [Thermococcus gorgonarius]ASJ00525.1 cysteine synthase [Thermococcus gorgonarius]
MSFAKLEFFNPFSRSIKDRTAFNMLLRAIERGDINGARNLFEASSGNTSISLAALSNVFGIKFRAYLPKPTPKATRVLLRVLGAKVVVTEFETIDTEMVEFVKKEARKARAANLNQFENDDNFDVHYRVTAREIEEQLRSIGKKPDVLIAGIGTSGHIAGIAKYLKERYDTRIVGVVPARGEKIPGIKRLETGQKWYSLVKIDRVVEVTRSEAIEGSIDIARRDGLLIGLSSGAVAKAYERVSEEFGEGTYVLIFPDDGFKYVEVFEGYLGMT